MRKSIIAAMLASLVFLAAFAPPALASPLHNAVFTVGQTTYVADGLAKKMDGAPFLKQPEDRVFVPVRYLGYALGLTDSDITWDQANQMAILSLGNTTVVLTPKEKTYYLNGQAKQMDVLPLLKSGRLYLPARYVAEAFGYSVSWDQATKSVVIGPAQSGSSGTTQTSVSSEYNLQIVPVPSSAQVGQSVQLDISVTNTSNQPASGVTVYLTSNSNSVQLSPAVIATNSNGQGVVTASDSNAESVTFTATVANSYTKANTTVQWSGTENPSSTQTNSNYYLGLSSYKRFATTGEPVVFPVTVVNAGGNPVDGTAVNVVTNSANVVLSATNLVTDAQGQAFFIATDNSPETVTFTLSPTAGGSPQTANVAWSAPPSTPDDAAYSATPSLAISSTASTANIGQPVVYTITAKGNNGSNGSNTLVVTANSVNAQMSNTVLTINNAGQTFFTATDNLAEDVTFTARMSTNTAVMAAATTQWLNSYVQPDTFWNNSPVYLLQINASPHGAALGQPAVIAMTVLDNNNQPAAGIGIFLTSSSSNAHMSANFVTSNSQGQAYVTVTDSTAENATFTGSLANVTSRRPNVSTSVAWSSQTNGPMESTQNPVEISGYTATLSQSTTSPNVGEPAVLTVTITNSSNQPVSGLHVLASSSSSNVQLTETNSVTNTQGEIFLTAVDNSAENVIFRIQLESDGSYGIPVSVGTLEWN